MQQQYKIRIYCSKSLFSSATVPDASPGCTVAKLHWLWWKTAFILLYLPDVPQWAVGLVVRVVTHGKDPMIIPHTGTILIMMLLLFCLQYLKSRVVFCILCIIAPKSTAQRKMKSLGSPCFCPNKVRQLGAWHKQTEEEAISWHWLRLLPFHRC